MNFLELALHMRVETFLLQVLWEFLLSSTISLTCTNDYKTAVSWHLDFIGCQALPSRVGGEEETQQQSKLSSPEFANTDFQCSSHLCVLLCPLICNLTYLQPSFMEIFIISGWDLLCCLLSAKLY